MKKSSLESKLVISEVMLPNQANVEGNKHGGEIMKLMDSTAYAASRKYAKSKEYVDESIIDYSENWYNKGFTIRGRGTSSC